MTGLVAAQWQGLAEAASRATGADPGLDAALAATFGVALAHFTGSAEAAQGLAAAVLPGWRLHVGFDATGVFPYARLSNNGARVQAGASSLPLAIVRAVVAATEPPALLAPPAPPEA